MIGYLLLFPFLCYSFAYVTTPHFLHVLCKVEWGWRGVVLYKQYRSPTRCNINGLLIITISSTCFARWFRPSSGAIDCVYSLWYNAPTMLPACSLQAEGLIDWLTNVSPFQFFFQSREQVVVRRGQIWRIGWVIKTLKTQVGQFLLGCKCPVSRFLPGRAKDLSAPCCI
jgi:hypothetical protein